jgi:hypothetical protein
MTPETKWVASFMPEMVAVKSRASYIWAVVTISAIGALVVLAVLWMRPTADPLAVVLDVSKGVAPTIAGVLAYMKAQDTHLMVNSRLDQFISAQSEVARNLGIAQGAINEQTRVAEIKRLTSIAVAEALAAKTPQQIVVEIQPNQAVPPSIKVSDNS